MIKNITSLIFLMLIHASSYPVIGTITWNLLSKCLSTGIRHNRAGFYPLVFKKWYCRDEKFPIFLHGEYTQKLRKEIVEEEFKKLFKVHQELNEATFRAIRARSEKKEENRKLKAELLSIVENGPFKEIASTGVGENIMPMLENLNDEGND